MKSLSIISCTLLLTTVIFSKWMMMFYFRLESDFIAANFYDNRFRVKSTTKQKHSLNNFLKAREADGPASTDGGKTDTGPAFHFSRSVIDSYVIPVF